MHGDYSLMEIISESEREDEPLERDRLPWLKDPTVRFSLW